MTVHTQHVAIELGDRGYQIAIGADLFDNPASYGPLPKASAALIVSNTKVAPLYARRLAQAIEVSYERVIELVLPDGEEFKPGKPSENLRRAPLCGLRSQNRAFRARRWCRR